MRKFGLQTIKLINLIRFFGVFNGLEIFISLLSSKNGYHKIKKGAFSNTVLFRKDQSDTFIFEQVFCEQQYSFDYLPAEEVEFILDAGANIGMAALYFAYKYPNAKIVSIEPDTANFELLKKNTAGYPNITCIQAALWHKNEKLHISNTDEFSAGYMMQPTTPSEEQTMAVPGMTINEIMEANNRENISILKIDIEGSEKEIFAFNAESWLKKTKVVITELHDWLKPGTSQVFFKTMSAFDWITYIKGENIICIKNK